MRSAAAADPLADLPLRLRHLFTVAPERVPIPSNGSVLSAHGARYDVHSLERFCPSNRMPRMYAHFGFIVGQNPTKFILIGLLIASLSLGLAKVNLEDQIRDGYTPSTSRARQESDILRNFLNSTIDPISTIVLFRARDNGSMHRLRHLKETWKLAEYLRDNLTVSYRDGDRQLKCRYSDFCGSFCNSNIFLRSFMWALEKAIERYDKGEPMDPSMNLSFPAGRANFDYRLESYFFGVRTRGADDPRPPPRGIIPHPLNGSGDSALDAARAVTTIDFVELIMLIYRGDFVHEGDENRMRAWEMGAYRFLRNDFHSDLIEVLVLGNDIVDSEMKEDGKRMTPYFVIGFMLTICFCVFTVITDSVVERVMDTGKIIVAFVLIICPALAITSTFGIFGLIGQRINSVAMITPFLIMGIGVNDAFLMLHAWHRTSIQGISIPQRMALILEEVGPSITITTVTDCTTFVLGSLTPTAEISLFCRITAVALALCYVFTLLLFLPVIAFCSRLEREALPKQRTPNARTQQLARLYNEVSVAYCRWIQHPATGIAVILIVASFLAFSIVGFVRIDSRLDTEKILPHDSPIREPHSLIAHKVWTDYYPVTIFVNRPLDLDSPTQMALLMQMVSDFERMNKCRGADYTHIWVRDYEVFRREDNFFGDFFEYDDPVFGSAISTTTSQPRPIFRPFYQKLEKFLKNAFYSHYRAFLKLDPDFDIPVRSFWFSVIYHNTTNWDERIDLMLELRSVADRYADLNVSVWEVNGMFVDQMLSLKPLTYYNGIVTILCMTVMCIFFISQWFLICLAVLSIAAITIEVIGCLSWWGLDLDPVTLCAILMSIGMSVDFTAHISYHFKMNDSLRVHDRNLYRYRLTNNQQRVIATLEAVGWPTVQAGVSTLICVLPLIALQNYVPLVFVKTITLVVLCGLLHGLVIMPAVFSLSFSIVEYIQKALGLKHSPPKLHTDETESRKHTDSYSFHELLRGPTQLEADSLLVQLPADESAAQPDQLSTGLP